MSTSCYAISQGSESSMKISYKRTTKCGLAFGEASSDGTCVELKNNTNRDFDVSKWSIKKGSASFTFPEISFVPRGGYIRVYSDLASEQAKHGDLVAKFKTWGSSGVFVLGDEKQMERATMEINNLR